MKKLEKKDFEIKINEILEKLSNELSQGYSENYINFIKFMGNFHEYSLNNLILIFSQYPNASRVAGFKTWEKLGFKILKGSKAIKILAPREVIYILMQSSPCFHHGGFPPRPLIPPLSHCPEYFLALNCQHCH